MLGRQCTRIYAAPIPVLPTASLWGRFGPALRASSGRRPFACGPNPAARRFRRPPILEIRPAGPSAPKRQRPRRPGPGRAAGGSPGPNAVPPRALPTELGGCAPPTTCAGGARRSPGSARPGGTGARSGARGNCRASRGGPRGPGEGALARHSLAGQGDGLRHGPLRTRSHGGRGTLCGAVCGALHGRAGCSATLCRCGADYSDAVHRHDTDCSVSMMCRIMVAATQRPHIRPCITYRSHGSTP